MGHGPSPQRSWILLERGCVWGGEQTRSQVTVIKCQVIISHRRESGLEGARRVTGLESAPVSTMPYRHSLRSHHLPLSLIPQGEENKLPCPSPVS